MKTKSFPKIKLNIYVIVPLLFIVALLASLSVYYVYISQRVHTGISVANTYVGGMTKSEAISALGQNIEIPQKVNIRVKDKAFELSLSEIGFSYDVNGTADIAFNKGKSGNTIANILSAVRAPFQRDSIDLLVSLDEDKLSEYLAIIASEVATEPVVPGVTLVNGKPEVEKGKPGETIDKEKFSQDLSQKLKQNDFSDTELSIISVNKSLTEAEALALEERAKKLIGKSLTLENEFDKYPVKDSDLVSFLDPFRGSDPNKIQTYIDKQLSGKINREPQNAVFRMENGSVQDFMPAKNGLVISKNALHQKIDEEISKLETSDEKTASIKIPVESTPPQIAMSDVNNLGIQELIGRGSSRFPGSIPGRIFNVGLASSKFKSVIIAPGETLSFNSVLGDVSSLTGYKQAYVIKDGRTVLGDGGGVCQVSTTLFRAALNAGLPITERHAHSYRVSYYESDSKPGLDATVYAPTSDLKIINDTPGHILIQSIYNKENLSLVFEIYGTSDGRVATITEPKIVSQTPPPPDLYIDDPTLPAGKVKQIDHKAWGARVNFEYKVVRNDEVLIEKTFYSNYRPWQSVFMRGTGPTI